MLRLRKENFDTHGDDAGQLVPGRSWAAWARALGHLLPPLDVADLGCGEGYLTIEAAGWARRVIAVDRSATCSSARARWPAPRAAQHHLEAGSSSACRSATASVDVALLSQALHHAADPGAALAEAARILRPGGRVLLARPAAARRGLGARAARRPLARVHRRRARRAAGRPGSPTSGSRSARAAPAIRSPSRRQRREGPRAGQRAPAPARREGTGHGSAADEPRPSTPSSASAILVLDGAMGTMIQRHGLGEADFRGERFARSPARPQGRQRPARADAAGRDRARSTTRTSRPAPTSSRPTRSTAPRSRRPTTASRRSCYEMNVGGGAARAASRRRVDGAHAGPAALRRRLDRARPTGRSRSRPTSTTRRSAASRSTSCATPTPSRSAGCIDGGVDLLLVETIFDTLNAKAALVAIEEVFDGARRAAAGDDLGHDHRPQRPHAVGPDGRGVLGLDRARRAVQRRPQLRARRRARCGRTSRSSPRIAADATSAATRTPGLPNAFGEYDETARRDGRRCSASSPRAGLVNIVGGCCGTTPEHIRAIARAVEGLPPRRIRADDRTAVHAASPASRR